LHQNWMRDYDPTTGRYVEADPLGLVDGASVYGYARQSPAKFTDPTGECPMCGAIVAGAAIGAGVDILAQLYANDGNFYCIDWWEVGREAAIGAAFGAAAETYNAFKATQWAEEGVQAFKAAAAQAAARHASWQSSEAALNALTGGAKATLNTPYGIRFVDSLSNGVAHKAKTGFTSLTKFVERQIAKDAALVSNRDITSASWHFYKSAITGQGGYTRELYDAQYNAGIEVVTHF
jgi:hypothetical protein